MNDNLKNFTKLWSIHYNIFCVIHDTYNILKDNINDI